jgi:hypothetical protein
MRRFGNRILQIGNDAQSIGAHVFGLWHKTCYEKILPFVSSPLEFPRAIPPTCRGKILLIVINMTAQHVSSNFGHLCNCPMRVCTSRVNRLFRFVTNVTSRIVNADCSAAYLESALPAFIPHLLLFMDR